jgi:SAM-dependent methyltransferase
MLVDDSALLRSHHEALVREIRDSSETIERFERESGIGPYFRTYHASYLGTGRRLRRTADAAVARRHPIIGFVRGLQRDFGPHPLVLDVGSGYGADSFLLARLGCRVLSVDPTEDFVAVAQRRLDYWRPLIGDNPEPEFSAGYIEERRDLPSGAFHGIYAAECLHHCEPVENALLAMRRVIHERGRALVLESNAANPAVVWKRNRVAAAAGARRVLSEEAGEFRIWGNEAIRTPRTWRRVFHDCGFRTAGQRFSRHVLAEIMGSPSLERLLSSVPGAGLASIHVAFELEPRLADVVAEPSGHEAD